MIETVFLCNSGWICEDYPDQPWEHDGCEAAGELCKNPQFVVPISRHPDESMLKNSTT
jgi:hypothetical protein